MTPNVAFLIDRKLRSDPSFLDRVPEPMRTQFFALRHAQALEYDEQWTYLNDSNATAMWAIPASYAEEMYLELDYIAERKSWNVGGKELYNTLIALGWNPPGFPVVIG
jgi:hypothetical protein